MNEQQMIVLVGVSGCGKSTFADKYISEHPDTILLSSDALRKELTGDENNQQVTGQVFGLIKYKADTAIKSGKSVMVDATSLNPRERKDYLNIADKYNVPAIAYVFERSKDQIIKNQEKRASNGGRRVPDEIIDKMLAKYVCPSQSEGFKQIIMM
jgi:protein phosphatase